MSNSGPGRARGRGAPPRAQNPHPYAPSKRGGPAGGYAEGRPRGAGPSTSATNVPPMKSTVEAMKKVQLSDAATSITGRGGRTARTPNIIRTRPKEYANSKKGENGTKICLTTNYFRLLTRPKWTLYQYRVDINPQEDRTFVRKVLLRDHKAKLGGYIFDGTVLYTTQRLNPNLMTLHSKRAEDGETMAITIKLVGDVVDGDYAYIQLFNILMRKCYSALKLQLVGRDFYDPNAKIDVPEYKLQIWPGYKTTIRQYESSIMMVAEITHKIIRMDTVFDLLLQTRSNVRSNYQQTFQKDIIGQVVLTDYNNKTYKISDVDWKSNPNGTFPIDGKEVSFRDYYKKKYNITIRDLQQPLLVSLAKPRDIRRGMSNIILLIPELCRMTGLTDRMRSDFRLMKAISNYTRVAPESRINKLLQFNRRLQTNKQCISELNDWDLKMDEKLVELPARMLQMETVYQGNNIKYPAGESNDGWNRSMRSNLLLALARVEKWAVVFPYQMGRDMENFVRMVVNNAAGIGFKLGEPTYCELKNDSVGVYISKLEELISYENPTMLLCIIGSNKNDLYNAIKKKCSIDRCVPTQIVTSRTLTNKNAMTIATKVAIQMNCKVGGSPWTVHIPLTNLMFIGYDVCHDPRDRSNSYGAMVATLDDKYSKFYSTVTKHKNGEELANEFGINIKKTLHEYYKLNKTLPAMVIIYRDGVGEGQLSYVYEHEVEIVKKSLLELYGANPYRLSFIIVTKHLNTRFFFNKGNPKPGTVIDDVVTSPEKYDFFLISQAVREGTVSPTSYNVLFDNTGLSPDKTQRLTFKMCHLYYNFSGPVRVPALCQYAHKLAFQASQSLGAPPNERLSRLLHFL